VCYAITLSVLNFAEYPLYIVALIDSHWLLVGIVVLRTLFFMALALEYACIAYGWCLPETAYRRGFVILMGGFAMAGVAGVVGITRDYARLSYEISPFRPAVDYLRQQAGSQAGFLATSLEGYEGVYPFLNRWMPLHLVDTWHERPPWQPRLEAVVMRYPDLWVCSRERGEIEDYLDARLQRVAAWKLGACELTHYLSRGRAGIVRRGDWRLGENLHLIGFQVSPDDVVEPGERLRIDLYWRAGSAPSRRYTVFTHLLDPAGRIQGQLDTEPCGGWCPTSGWRAADVIEDVYHFTVNTQATAGEYLVEVGMYDTETQVRLPAYDANGQRLPDDRIILGTVKVLRE
jgi:hypothetical protein